MQGDVLDIEARPFIVLLVCGWGRGLSVASYLPASSYFAVAAAGKWVQASGWAVSGVSPRLTACQPVSVTLYRSRRMVSRCYGASVTSLDLQP